VADRLADVGLEAAGGAGERGKGDKQYKLWAATNSSNMRANSGSYVDSHGWNLLLGWARQDAKESGTKTVFSPFVAYGKGSYDSYLDDGTHGSGKLSYLGVGVIAKQTQKSGLWIEGAVQGGRSKSDYAGSIDARNTTTYDSSTPYFGAQIGIGKDVRMKEGEKLTGYARYFFTHTGGSNTDLVTRGKSETYTFDGVNSNRVRLGMKYSHRDSADSEVYAGLAWEYELSGKASASYRGFETPSPSLRGGSAMLELGYRFAPKDSRLSYQLHLTGWQGKREGMTGGAQLNYAF